MKLIPISPNVLVNPEQISCVEQRNTNLGSVTVVMVGDKEYYLTFPLNEFFKNLEQADDDGNKQIFGG